MNNKTIKIVGSFLVLVVLILSARSIIVNRQNNATTKSIQAESTKRTELVQDEKTTRTKERWGSLPFFRNKEAASTQPTTRSE